MVRTRLQLKIDTAANWETAGNNGFIPKAGEPIYYKAEGGNPPRQKIGDGVTNVNDLMFVSELPAGIVATDPDGDGNVVMMNISEAYSFAESNEF